MTMGPVAGLVGSAAGAPLSQTAGSEAERTQRDAATQQRGVDATQKADQAAGIGQTEQDQESSERDADGRRFWEGPPQPNAENQQDAATEPPLRQSKDATGQSGTQLDLTG